MNILFLERIKNIFILEFFIFIIFLNRILRKNLPKIA